MRIPGFLSYLNPLNAFKTPTRALVTTGVSALGLGSGIAYNNYYVNKANKKFDEEAALGNNNSYRLPQNFKYSLNKVQDGIPSVFTDVNAAKSGLTNAPNRKLLDLLTSSAPAYLPEHKSVFLNKKYLNTKVLGHELGHHYDESLDVSDRNLTNPKNLWYGLYNADESPMVRQEAKAWDLAGIPAGDPVREAALDTYRSVVRYNSYGGLLYPAGFGVGASILTGYGVDALLNKYRYIKNRKRALEALKNFRRLSAQYIPELARLNPVNGSVEVPQHIYHQMSTVADRLPWWRGNKFRRYAQLDNLMTYLSKLSKLKLRYPRFF